MSIKIQQKAQVGLPPSGQRNPKSRSVTIKNRPRLGTGSHCLHKAPARLAA